MAYQYQQIDPQSKQFRLLSLLPGKFEDPVHCRLELFSLDEVPAYETLSYVWGDSSDTRTILVDGSSLTVTANLDSALRHLRLVQGVLILWIDAICIHQAVASEKTHQVAMMSSIYTRCSGVYLWLGEEQSRSDDPLLLIEHFADNKHIHELPGYAYDYTMKTHHFSRDDSVNMWNDFCDLALRPWWFRVWTVQEAALPPNATVIIGKRRFPWQLLDRAHDNRIRHRWTCCSHADSLFPPDWTSICDNFFCSVNYITTNRRRLTSDQYFPFRQTLLAYGGRNATDPRDKIIGLLGLANPHTYQHFIPDYAKTARIIYVEAFRAMIDEGPGDLRCLTGSGFNSGVFGLPSWVPDLSRSIDNETNRREISRLDQYQLYDATRCTTPFVAHDEAELRLRGCKVDQIVELSCVANTVTDQAMRTTLEEWLAFAEKGGTTGRATKSREFWKTAVAGIIYLPQTDNVDEDTWVLAQDANVIPEHFEEWMSGLLGDSTAKPQIISLRVATYHRMMSKTIGGLLGLCPQGAQVGDEIWLLYGSRVPFVLRPLGSVNFALIGDCYLDGAMDGSMVDRHDEKIVTLA